MRVPKYVSRLLQVSLVAKLAARGSGRRLAPRSRLMLALAMLLLIPAAVLVGLPPRTTPNSHRLVAMTPAQPRDTATTAAATATPSPPVARLRDRTLRVDGFTSSVSPTGPTRGLATVGMTATLQNTGKRAFAVQPGDFAVTAEGDTFGVVPAHSTNAGSTRIAPGAARALRLTFMVPPAALPETVLRYSIPRQNQVAVIPLQVMSAAPRVAALSTQSGNMIEDTFTRADQMGWGTTSNGDGIPSVVWGMDGDGTKSFVTLADNTGSYAYPGATNLIGIAAAGSAAFNGGDALVAFQASAVGHLTPYVVVNACPDKSCYYGARLHTSQNKLELARRGGNFTMILASTPFTPSPATRYWMRLDVVPMSGSATLRAKIWADGTPEPDWMLTATDNQPLAANLVGTGGSWDLAGVGESIGYICYAFAISTLAAPCASGTTPPPPPTPTPTASTPTPTNTPTPGPDFNTYFLQPQGGRGEPWGTVFDAAGNLWFAEPGCDFAPTCSSSAATGQLGVLSPTSGVIQFYTLPNISGNQPIFVALGASGKVWFTTPNNSMIGEFDPTTQAFVGQWPVTPGSGPWDLTFSHGGIWYTEHYVAGIGRFDPVTHSVTDFATPSANTVPYGIAANDPVNDNLIWFTENNSSVAQIAVLDQGNGDQIAEYRLRAHLDGANTPHMIALDAQGHPWWTEGWDRDAGTLDPTVAIPGQCGASTGSCAGVTEILLPPPDLSCSGSHVSGVVVQGGGQLIWTTNSLSAQIGAYSPTNGQFATYRRPCSAHPHDGLNIDATQHLWWDEEFGNDLAELAST